MVYSNKMIRRRQLAPTTLRHHRRLAMLKQYNRRIQYRLFLQDLQAYPTDTASLSANGAKYTLSHQQDYQQNEDDQQDDDGFNLSSFLSSLSPQDRQAFRQENPDISPLMLMTKKEKKEYFEKLNASFRRDLSKTPTRKTKTKKIIKFKTDFSVKPFNQHQKVTAVTRAKELTQKYQSNIHFS